MRSWIGYITVHSPQLRLIVRCGFIPTEVVNRIRIHYYVYLIREVIENRLCCRASLYPGSGCWSAPGEAGFSMTQNTYYSFLQDVNCDPNQVKSGVLWTRVSALYLRSMDKLRLGSNEAKRFVNQDAQWMQWPLKANLDSKSKVLKAVYCRANMWAKGASIITAALRFIARFCGCQKCTNIRLGYSATGKPKKRSWQCQCNYFSLEYTCVKEDIDLHNARQTRCPQLN